MARSYGAHKVRDWGKVEALATSMAANGWQGAPIVLLDDTQAMTGVHRLAACAQAEIEPETVLLEDRTRTILAHNDSPDVGFDVGINPYRGCSHGCAYCYARPMHEYLGFSAGLDFETRILVKRKAPDLLREALSSKRWTPRVIAMTLQRSAVGA